MDASREDCAHDRVDSTGSRSNVGWRIRFEPPGMVKGDWTREEAGPEECVGCIRQNWGLRRHSGAEEKGKGLNVEGEKDVLVKGDVQ